jgi:AraC-like DNA-binding protein
MFLLQKVIFAVFFQNRLKMGRNGCIFSRRTKMKTNIRVGSVTYYSEDSYDEFSVNYLRSRNDLELTFWYDEYPFSLGVWPGLFREVVRKGNWFVRRVNYPFLAVEMVLDGEMQFGRDGREFILKPGDIFVSSPREQVLLTNSDSCSVRMLQLIIYGGFAGMISEMLNFKDAGILQPENPELVEKKLRSIGKLIAANEDAKGNSSAGYELLMELADIHRKSRLRKYPPALAKAVTLVDLCMGANLNVNSLAYQTGVSRYTLIRLFRGWLGRTPQEYIAAQRMEYAKQLVCSGRLSHKEIAQELGFKNASHFSLAFKKYTGMAPRTFKASLPF